MARKRKPPAEDENGSESLPNNRSDGKKGVDWSKVAMPLKWKVVPLKASQVPRPPRPSKKRRTDGDPFDYDAADDGNQPNQHQESPFQGSNVGTVNYRIEPSHIWIGMKKYRKFTIQDISFHVGDFVLVKNLDLEENETQDSSYWVALVVEARASDALHVFLRVFWMYKPEELPGGRRSYHGAKELIASNHMDIIDAATVDDKASVIHWREDNERVELLDPLQYFWRQTFDINRKNNYLSDLPLHCIDRKEFNPNDLLIQCDNCKGWLHNQCIEQAAIKKIYEDNNLEYPEFTTTTNEELRKPRHNVGTASPSDPDELIFGAKVTSGELGTVVLTVTDFRTGGSPTSEDALDIICLLCGQPVDDKQNPCESPMRDSPKSPQQALLEDSPKSPQQTLLEDSPKASQQDAVKDNPTTPRQTPVRDSPEALQPTPVSGSPKTLRKTPVSDHPTASRETTVSSSPEASRQTTVSDSPEAPRETTPMNSPRPPVESHLTDGPKAAAKDVSKPPVIKNKARKLGPNTLPFSTKSSTHFKQAPRFSLGRSKPTHNDDGMKPATADFLSDHDHDPDDPEKLVDEEAVDPPNTSRVGKEKRRRRSSPVTLSPPSGSGWNPLNRRTDI